MAAEQWKFDLVHSSINFWVRHMMVSKVHGRFAAWNGTLEFDEANPSASKVSVEIDAASIDTKEPQRDGHLKSGDFLDAEKHPKLTFKGTSVEKAGPSEYKLKGDLTIRGVTHPVTLDVEYAGRAKHDNFGERAGFSARTSISRKEWGLTWNVAMEAGGILVGDKIDIILEIEAIKA